MLSICICLSTLAYFLILQSLQRKISIRVNNILTIFNVPTYLVCLSIGSIIYCYRICRIISQCDNFINVFTFKNNSQANC